MASKNMELLEMLMGIQFQDIYQMVFRGRKFYISVELLAPFAEY